MIPRTSVPWTLGGRYAPERLLLQNDECDLYLAYPHGGDSTAVTLRIYRPGLSADPALLERVAGLITVEPYTTRLIDYDHAKATWLVQEFLPLGSLRDLMNFMNRGPFHEERSREVVAAVTRCLDGWQNTLGHQVGDFGPEDLLVRQTDPLVLALGHHRAAQWAALPGGSPWPAAPETLEGVRGAPAAWWTLGVVAHELLTGRPAVFEPGDAAVDLGAAGREGWEPLLAGLLTIDPAARWGAAEVRSWLAGAAPDVAAVRRYAPVEFAGRSHATPAALAIDLTARPGAAESWLRDGGRNRLATWLDREVRDERFDRGWLDKAEPVAVAAFAAAFTAGLRPRYRGMAIDAEGLLDLARGGSSGHHAVADAVAAGALAHAARHRCSHPRCPEGTAGGCARLLGVEAEVPVVMAEVRAVLDRLYDIVGPVSAETWERGVAAAVELCLVPQAARAQRWRLRAERLHPLRRAAIGRVTWWSEQRRKALKGNAGEVETRAAIVSVLLLTSSADEAGRQLAEESREEFRRRRQELTDQGRSVLVRAGRTAESLWFELRLRYPAIRAAVTRVLVERSESGLSRGQAGWRHARARWQSRYGRWRLDRAERRRVGR
ncbi:serine/threonine protein kinase [Streptosporangium canum]|uniref:serine/threonine protein kinase n=1 Tax=Streptosporangium canum TaxID=324952 RepID=UPI0034279BA0